MPTINSFPIQTKRVIDLEVMAGSDISEQDKTLVYDQSLGLWKSVTIAESAYYSSVVFNTPAQSALASLPVGAKYSTKGALTVGDGGHGSFIVEAASGTPDGYSRVLLANGNHGVLQPVNGSLNIAQFGEFSALSDEKGKFDAVITACAERRATLVTSGSMTILTSGGHVLPAGFALHCKDLTIKRVMSGYTGQEPICEFLDDVTVVGNLVIDGNNPLEAGAFEGSFPSLLVSGSNVAVRGKLSLVNTPMYDGAAKQLRGCVVTGDNFYCREVYGNLCGYGTMNLLITGQMKSFFVGKYFSENHHYKGFSVNSADNTSLIETIRFDSFKAQTGNEFAHDASSGFQIDTKSDNNIIQVLSCEIGTLDVVGGRAGVKVENTLNFYADNIILDVTTDLVPGGYAMTMHAVNFRCPSITFNNSYLRIRSNYCWLPSINCEHTNGSPILSTSGLIWLESLADTSTQLIGDKDHYIGRITTKRELTIPSLIRIDIEQDINYKCRVEHPDTHSVDYVFTNFDGFDKVRGGNLSVGYVDDMAKLNSNNNIQKWVAVGSGLYSSRGGIPTLGTYKLGDYVKNLATTRVGTAPTGYILKGWICTTGGTEGTFVFDPDRAPLV